MRVTARKLSELTGVSMRQISYWIDSGYLFEVPREDGKRGVPIEFEGTNAKHAVLTIDLYTVGFQIAKASEYALKHVESGDARTVIDFMFFGRLVIWDSLLGRSV